MAIPCGEKEHWRFISLWLFWPEEEFDAEGFAKGIGVADVDEEWVVQAAKEPSCHTHGRLRHITDETANEEEGEVSAAWVCELDTVRAAAQYEGLPTIELRPFLDTMAAAATAEECFVAATVHLSFGASAARWRPALLADPPELSDLKEDLGRIVLSGLTLRFEESAHGLVEAHLEASPSEDEYRTELQYSEVVPPERLQDLYRIVLDKAERFASLFVHFG